MSLHLTLLAMMTVRAGEKNKRAKITFLIKPDKI